MKILLTIIALPFLIIFRLVMGILATLLRLVFGSTESRDTKRICSITADIEDLLQQDLFGDQSESAKKIRNEVKKQLFAERELLFAKYPD